MKQKLLRLGTLIATFGGILLLSSQALAAGYTWTEQTAAGARLWNGIAMSSDGQQVAAVAQGSGNVWISADAGVTWTPHASGGSDLHDVASSADGTHLVVLDGAISAGWIWTSSDTGATWTSHAAAGSRLWNRVVTSSDGKYIMATAGDGFVYVSNDFGTSWAAHAVGSTTLNDIAISADGSRAAVQDITLAGGDIWTSNDFGVTWTDTGKNSPNWGSIASSADGSHLVATTLNVGDVYTSSDFGVTWAHHTFTGDQIDRLASSSSGQYLAAAGNGGGTSYTYTSADFGVTWTQQTGAGQGNWRAIAMSANGSRLAMVNYDPSGTIWTAYDPALDIVTAAATSSSTNPSAPDTGFGVATSHPLRTLVVFGVLAAIVAGCALFLRRKSHAKV